MKNRQGFISNSSSSSFAILGKQLSVSELERLVNEDKNVLDHIKCIGKYLCEGQDVFDLTEEMYNWVMTHEVTPELKFVYVIYHGSEEGIIKKSDIKFEEFQIFSGEEDYHETKDLETFIEYYED